MKFLCLCHYEAAAFAKLAPEDFMEIGEICAPHDAELKASGHVDMIGSLGTPDTYRCLRVVSGEVADEPRPYAPTAEPFGAFFIVDAADMDEALQIAKLHPGVHLGDRFGKGGIEVRPIENLEIVNGS
jgi:hypothetical protein